MGSLGRLVDRLSIVNLKLWRVQDQVHAAVEAATTVSAETLAMQVELNRERNQIIAEIDALGGKAVSTWKKL